jgi:DNA-binding NarL/FixJ family response regulator
MSKTVVIVEDNRGLREQLMQILETAPDLKCLGAYVSAEAALPEILAKKPDVVLMDIKLPGMSGIQCVAELQKIVPGLQIIVVPVFEDSERIFHALKAGASGYLVKSSPPVQLLESIRDVHNRGAPMCSHIARKVAGYFDRMGPDIEEAENISPRELQVLDLLSEGFSYQDVGEKLDVGAETVRSHVKNICQKMQAHSRLEAVANRRPAKC